MTHSIDSSWSGLPRMPIGSLRRTCDLSKVRFERSDQLPEPPPHLGQQRATDAIRFAIQMADDGYNAVVLGPDGSHWHGLATELARDASSSRRRWKTGATSTTWRTRSVREPCAFRPAGVQLFVTTCATSSKTFAWRSRRRSKATSIAASSRPSTRRWSRSSKSGSAESRRRITFEVLAHADTIERHEASTEAARRNRTMPGVLLPVVELHGGSGVEAALEARRSVRQFGQEGLSLTTLGQLLWAAQGVTAADGGRTAPSAGALYPLELFVAAGRVDGLPPGVYRYTPAKHSIRLHLAGDCRRALSDAALEQTAVRNGAAVLVIAAIYTRTSAEYGARAERYVHMEAGHAAQNVYLQATSLDLGTVVVGAFEDDLVGEVLRLPANVAPLALLPVGVQP